jgi:hypothetical protein
VVLRLSQSADFSITINKMRSWVDAHGCSSFRFKNHQQSDTVLVKVEFTKGRDADAFKSRFDSDDSYVVNPTRRGLQETMDQVCWWRLMAEETRTQGDQFGLAAF